MAHHGHHHFLDHIPSSSTPISTTNTAAPMPMTFTFSTDPGPLLFSFWHPTTVVAYAFSLVVVFALGVCSEWLSAHARHAHHATATAEITRICDDNPAARRSKPWMQSLAMHALSISLNLSLMLLAMTFNVGVFAAAVFGVAFARTTTSRSWEVSGVGHGVELCH